MYMDLEGTQAEQPVPSEGEWRTESRGISPKVYVCDEDGVIACAGDEETASAIVKDHRLAALVPECLDALKGVAIVLNTELLSKYKDEPWAQRVRGAITDHEHAVNKEQENG